jgi:hypothetical protein
MADTKATAVRGGAAAAAAGTPDDRAEETSRDGRARIYTIRCREGKWYVGKTKQPVVTRYAKHCDGTAAAWTKRYPPVELRPGSFLATPGGHDEDTTTLRLMRKHGVDNVRGGAFAAVDLPEHHLKTLSDLLRSEDGTCYRCGLPGHFVQACGKPAASGAAAAAAPAPAPPAVSRAAGAPASAWTVIMGIFRLAKAAAKSAPAKKRCCGRCRRPGHTRTTCYATTTAAGDVIPAPAKRACGRCRRPGHTRKNCYAATDSTGAALSAAPTRALPADDACLRCGRLGHWIADCHASTHRSGRGLPDKR